MSKIINSNSPEAIGLPKTVEPFYYDSEGARPSRLVKKSPNFSLTEAQRREFLIKALSTMVQCLNRINDVNGLTVEASLNLLHDNIETLNLISECKEEIRIMNQQLRRLNRDLVENIICSNVGY